MEPDEEITLGKGSSRKAIIEVKLDDADFEYYPYCDTICYINSETGTASNEEWDEADRYLRDTDGGYSEL